MDHETTNDAAAVGLLLATAGITPSAEEVARFVRIYPLLRAQADALHAAEFAGEDFALGYDAAIGFS